MEIQTEYGTIKGIANYSFFRNTEQIEDICCDTKNEIQTSLGILIPRYSNPVGRRKSTSCLSFYKSGKLKSMDLQDQTNIQTSIGAIPAEFVSFYENGAVYRIFPRNSQISGFWTDEEENEITPALTCTLSAHTINGKMSSLTFYPEGSLKSLCLSPGEALSLSFEEQTIPVRYGISFYEDGTLQAVEPAREVALTTPLGELHAYHATALGIHADNCSLQFRKNGTLQSLYTSSDCLNIQLNSGETLLQKPMYQVNPLTNEGLELLPLQITFQEESITFRHPTLFNEKATTIFSHEIKQVTISKLPKLEGCSLGCANCQHCH